MLTNFMELNKQTLEICCITNGMMTVKDCSLKIKQRNLQIGVL
ncbi:hypothetical protein [Vallitalea okinawensis]|nr:hypothetical protein [Vallitalea okinawensis]